ATYVARAEGTAPRPPRTLIEQQKQTTNVNVVVPIKNYNNPVYSLKPVTQVQVQEFRKTSEQLRAFSQKRSQARIKRAKKQDRGKRRGEEGGGGEAHRGQAGLAAAEVCPAGREREPAAGAAGAQAHDHRATARQEPHKAAGAQTSEGQDRAAEEGTAHEGAT